MLTQCDLTLLMIICKILATGIHTDRLCDRRGLSVHVTAWGYHQCSYSLPKSIEQDYYWYYTIGG